MSFIDYTPALIVAVPLFGAFLTPIISKIGEKIRNIFAIIICIITTFLVFLLTQDVFTNGPRTYIFGDTNLNIPVVRILFEVDGISIFMGIISASLALLAVIYSWSFMKENDGLDKFYTLVLLLLASILGMELTGDVFNFFVFLEISCISSCALIAFYVNKGEVLEAAFKYIVISTIGALFVLFAVGLFYAQYNALNMAVIANALQFGFLDKIAFVLLIAALGMKAGLAPMHMWLPDSYGEAPVPVTFILVAATQASLYGVLRIIFTIYRNAFTNAASVLSSAIIHWFIIALALATILIGVIMALIQTDFKRLIAFAAVAEIGYIFLGIGVGLTSLGVGYGKTALEGGVFHIINDAFDIGLLFLIAGSVYYATKETSLNNIGGLARNMKYTTVFFIIGLLAVSGLPPFNGFVSKLLIYESTYQLNPIIAIIAILASILLLAVFVKVFYSVFMGPELPNLKDVKEVPKSMLFAMGVIVVIIIIFGLFPNLIINNIVQPATNALVNNSSYISKVISGVI
ncbi:MAG: proton-conducting transporter membrane subunit [Candidatus Thermoplasmatota archaeon]|jgi:multicomponent Na+:H+ antiporter subunit D|nr:proton-conducting transporter membrane subunit [Candidatus Thermoplasmatota archaeon]